MTEEGARRTIVEYREIIADVRLRDALDLSINALEKQIAKQHHHTKVGNINDSVRVSICPSCLGLIYTHREEYPNYCNNCGQKISWKDSEV